MSLGTPVGSRTFQPQILVEHQVIHIKESQGGDSPDRLLTCESHHFVFLSSCTQSAHSYVQDDTLMKCAPLWVELLMLGAAPLWRVELIPPSWHSRPFDALTS